MPQAALAAAFQPFTSIQGAPQLSAKYQRLKQQFAAMNKVQHADMRLPQLIAGAPDTAAGSRPADSWFQLKRLSVWQTRRAGMLTICIAEQERENQFENVQLSVARNNQVI